VVPAEILRLRVVGAAALHGLGPRVGVAHVVEERPNVVDLVCQRYPQRAWRCVGQMLDILLVADVPRGLGILVAVGARVDDVGDRMAVAPANVAQPAVSALVLAVSCSSAPIASSSVPPSSSTDPATRSR
jgi:hypothetical protein